LSTPGDFEILFAAAPVDQAQDRTLEARAVFVDHSNRMVEVVVTRKSFRTASG